MTMKKLALTVATATALLGASSAFADPRDFDRYDRPSHSSRDHWDHRDYRDYRRHEAYRHYEPRHVPERVVYMQSAPYYYAPQAPAYAPQPREIYGTFPIGNTDVRVGVQF